MNIEDLLIRTDFDLDNVAGKTSDDRLRQLNELIIGRNIRAYERGATGAFASFDLGLGIWYLPRLSINMIK